MYAKRLRLASGAGNNYVRSLSVLADVRSGDRLRTKCWSLLRFLNFCDACPGAAPARSGITAMQSFNITAINPLFMLALFGTAVACLFIVIFALLHWHRSGTIYLSIGSLLYLVGAILVTMLGNVPLNNALAQVKPDSLEGANLWAKYLTDWTFWNHVRTLSALAASATFILSLTK